MSLLWVNASARWVEHDDLSEPAQKAVHAYMMDGLNNGGFEDEDEMEAHKRNFHYREEHVPVEEAKRRIMSMGDHSNAHPDFDSYHKWYVGGGHMPNHPKDSRWPSIVAVPEDQDGYLDDGWHRFHHYVRSGDSHIPLLHIRRKDES